MSEAGTWDRTRIPESWHLPRVLTQMRERNQRGKVCLILGGVRQGKNWFRALWRKLGVWSCPSFPRVEAISHSIAVPELITGVQGGLVGGRITPLCPGLDHKPSLHQYMRGLSVLIV